MKRLNSVGNDQVQLEVIECDCGFHLGLDSAYLEQLDNIRVVCPACAALLDTPAIVPTEPVKSTPTVSTENSALTCNSIATTAVRLEKLLTEIVTLKLSKQCYSIIYDLAYTPPFQRLITNLSLALWLVRKRKGFNVLTDGLTHEERCALIEIDGANTSSESRRTAHSLFDIDERLRLLSLFSGTFADRWERIRHMLVEKPLDH